LKKAFAKAFSSSDIVMVSEVYSAGEKKPRNFKLDNLIKNISDKSKTKAIFYNNNNSILDLIDKSKGKTTILFLGAGSVTKWAYAFYGILKKAYD